MDVPEFAADVVSLLKAQGCFLNTDKKSSYSLAEVRTLFLPLRSLWYAKYYSHSLWRSLRNGNATKNELLAWVIHNYHISRSAGIIAARMASVARRKSVKSFFQKDTIEEYWHCDSFYFVRHPALNVPDKSIKQYVPIAATLAFENLALCAAETDPLCHLLIAYFQESSVMFYDDCLVFYSEVEKNYGIPGFFKSWQMHMRLDQDQGHAFGLSQMFDPESQVSASSVNRALLGAWLAYWSFTTSLDDIAAEALPASQVRLRLPLMDVSGMGAHWWEQFASIKVSEVAHCKTALELVRCIESSLNPEMGTRGAPHSTDIMLMIDAAVDSAYSALSHMRTHDEILAWGTVCKALSRISTLSVESQFKSPWAAGSAATLRFGSNDSTITISCIWLLLRIFEKLNVSPMAQDRLSAASSAAEQMLEKVSLNGDDLSRVGTALLSYCELLHRWRVKDEEIAYSEFTI